jgi:ribosomal protein S18 acetylase RimI-like enzyme
MEVSGLEIRTLTQEDIPVIAAAFAHIGWDKPASQYEAYLQEQDSGERTVLVAIHPESFAGYVTVRWKARYLPFREAQIPEITDFNVLPRFQRRGIGTRLMDEAENRIKQVSQQAGIGVGMTRDYGAAQRMYVLRGYVPDGWGLMDNGIAVEFGKQLTVNDELALYLIKNLK